VRILGKSSSNSSAASIREEAIALLLVDLVEAAKVLV